MAKHQDMGTNRPNGSLYIKRERNIASIEFGHPAGNSFVIELLDRLATALKELSEDGEIALIILKSEGNRTFCAGASFDELVQISNQEEGTRFFSGFANVINAMRKCPQPIIGRVQGKAVGGGVGLIAACDYVYATVDASVRLSEISIGIAPLVIAPAVERKIGKAALADMAFSPTEWKNAYWAKEQGLYAKVFDNIKELDKEVELMTTNLARYAKGALFTMKKVLWEGTSDWGELLSKRASMSGRLALSPESKESLQQIRKK